MGWCNQVAAFQRLVLLELAQVMMLLILILILIMTMIVVMGFLNFVPMLLLLEVVIEIECVLSGDLADCR